MQDSREANVIAVGIERLLCGLLLVCLFLYISVPALYVAGEDNDRSIRAVLNNCAIADCRSGVDYVITYGPTAWLANRASEPLLNGFQLVFWITCAAVVCAGIVQLRWFPMGRIAAWLVGLGFFATGVEPLYGLYFPDAFFLTFLALTASILLAAPLPPRTAVGKYVRYLYAFSSLLWICIIGFTRGTLLFPSLAVLILWAVRIGRRLLFFEAVYRLAGVFIALLLVWKLFGQYFSDLPRYVYTMIRIISGYPAGGTFLTRGNWTPNAVLALALLASTVISYGVALLFSQQPRPAGRQLGALVVISLCSLIAWKQTAESGGRVLIQILPAVIGLLILTLGSPRTSKTRIATLVFLGLSLPAIATNMRTSDGEFGFSGVVHAKTNTVAQSFRFWTSAKTRRNLNSRLLQDRLMRDSRLEMPRIQRLIGRRSVDLYGESQTVMLTNDFHWTPRPVYQSMVAFSPFLAELNRKRMSEDPPEFIIVTPAGYRNYPTMDDWPWTQLFIQNYRLVNVSTERDLYAYRQPADQLPVKPESTLISTVGFSWNSRIAVPRMPHAYIEMRMPIHLSWLGRLRALIFQHPAVYIDVQLQNGQKRSHTFNIATAGSGFMLSPYLETSNDIRNVMESVDRSSAVTSVDIRTENWKNLFVRPDNIQFFAVTQPGDN